MSDQSLLSGGPEEIRRKLRAMAQDAEQRSERLLVDVIGDVLTIASKINSLLQTIAKVIQDLPKATQAAG